MTADEMGRLISAGRGAAELPVFLSAGGDVNAVDPRSGMPLLHLACEHQNLEAIRALVATGAELNGRDWAGQTPLHVAADIDIDSVVQGERQELQFETTRVLMSLGADVGIRDRSNRTPREIAAGYGHQALDKFDRLVGQPT